MSERSRDRLAQDAGLVTCWGTPVECWSAVARLRRELRLTAEDEETLGELLNTLRESWVEVLPLEEVRERARRLLRLHPRRAADALQLAAALTCAGPPAGGFVAFDERLCTAARLEGLTVD